MDGRNTPETSSTLMKKVGAELYRCLSCNACRSNCTMQVATGRLQPLKLVRLANLGLMDELLWQPEIWYCLQCNRCTFLCPMTVKPATLIAEARQLAVRRGVVSLEVERRYEALCATFHRVRWHMVARVLEGKELPDLRREWQDWAEKPVEIDPRPVRAGRSAGVDILGVLEAFVGLHTDLSACMTCRECSTVCPVARESAVFDPLSIFRMVNLGLRDEVLESPSIWLCLGCQRCTRTCTQKVSGHLVIQSLQELVIRKSLVPQDIRDRLREIDGLLFPRFLQEVDALFSECGRTE